MASEVGSAYLTIMPSAKGFARALGNELDGSFVAAGRRGGGLVGDGVAAGGKASFVKAGAVMAGALAVGLAAAGAKEIVSSVTGYLADAIESASDLEQSIGGVDAVFKDNADTIHGWAKTAADSVGLARSEYNELATVLGAQLKNMGVPMEDVAQQTGDLIGLGADLAAQFGGSTSDAVSALSSLLRGERDPIERYGVSINEARIKAKMAEMGLEGLEGSAYDAGKAQATLALLTEQTADAQGAFARESGTLAGQQQRLKAEMENVKTEIGTALLPVVTDLLGVFRDEAVPILQDLAAWFTENKDSIHDLASGAADASLWFIDALLAMGENGAKVYGFFVNWNRAMVDGFFIMAGGVLDAAQRAWGWIPGVGDKLDGLEAGLDAAHTMATGAFDSMEKDANDAAAAFGEGRDAVQSLRDAVQNLDGKRATIYLNATGSAMQLYQRAPNLTPSVIPGRAVGGPVTAGRPYVVGEREAELFVPSQSGVILNQKQIAASMGQGHGGATVARLAPEDVRRLGDYIVQAQSMAATSTLAAADRAARGSRSTKGVTW